MSFDTALKRLKVFFLSVSLCMCAAFLSSCGSSDSSQTPVQTTASTDDASVLTVTTAAEKAETDDAISSQKPDESEDKAVTTKKTSESSSENDDAGSHSDNSSDIGPADSSGDSSSSQDRHDSSSDSQPVTTSQGKPSVTTAKTSQTAPQPIVPGQAFDSRQYLLEHMKDTKLMSVARSVMADMQAGKTEIYIGDGILKETRLSDFMGFISILEAESYIIPSPYSYTVNRSGYVTSIKVMKYPKNIRQYQNEKAAVDELAEEIVAQAEKTCSTQFDKVLYFHDYIINNCVYDLTTSNGASAYGCLIEGRAVCEGYAKAMQVLCSKAGIECMPVTGYASYGENTQSHMWNIINIDGCWTHVDATWDDIESRAINACCYSYFGLTDAEIRIDHSISDSSLVSIPKATSNSSSYYVRKGYYINSEARVQEVLRSAVDEAVKNSAETVTVRCGSEALYELANNTAASGKYEYMIELIKGAKNKYGTNVNASDGFLIGDCPNAKDTYTIIIFLKYGT